MQVILLLAAVYFGVPIAMLLAWDKCKAFALTPKEAALFVLVWPKYVFGG